MWIIDGKELRRRRLEKMLDQATFGRKVGISTRRLRDLEAGNGECVTPKNIGAMAKVLACEPTDIGRPKERASLAVAPPLPAQPAEPVPKAPGDRLSMDDLIVIERPLPEPKDLVIDGKAI